MGGHLWMSHATNMNESCHTYEWVMPHIWMSHVSHINESRFPYEWVMSHIKWVMLSFSEQIRRSRLQMHRRADTFFFPASSRAAPNCRIRRRLPNKKKSAAFCRTQQKAAEKETERVLSYVFSEEKNTSHFFCGKTLSKKCVEMLLLTFSAPERAVVNRGIRVDE